MPTAECIPVPDDEEIKFLESTADFFQRIKDSRKPSRILRHDKNGAIVTQDETPMTGADYADTN